LFGQIGWKLYASTAIRHRIEHLEVDRTNLVTPTWWAGASEVDRLTVDNPHSVLAEQLSHGGPNVPRRLAINAKDADPRKSHVTCYKPSVVEKCEAAYRTEFTRASTLPRYGASHRK
jgi:hypothetical protein